MKTLASNNNESINGMSQVIIDMRPQVKHQDGHGREVLADVHFRINVRAYTDNLYTYTQEATEASNKAVTAFDNEVVEMLKAEGWTLRKEKFGVGDCPQLVKGTQYLYCHPQDISGEVNPADIETLEARIKTLTSCKYYTTDNYGDIIVTTSESDEKQLYRDTYADGLGAIWQECTTTKRSNLYKDKAEAEHCVRRRICIANRRADLNDIGTGSYNMRTPLLQFLMEEYDRLLQAGYIKEAAGQNGRTLCRWINKKEEKELNKARREAEKAEKERKAAERQDRPVHVNTSWATDYTPDDFQKLTSRYEIADEDRDIVGRRFHTGEGLWTIDVFVSDYAGNPAIEREQTQTGLQSAEREQGQPKVSERYALIYLLTGEGEVRANVLSLDHLRATLTEAKGWHEVAA